MKEKNAKKDLANKKAEFDKKKQRKIKTEITEKVKTEAREFMEKWDVKGFGEMQNTAVDGIRKYSRNDALLPRRLLKQNTLIVAFKIAKEALYKLLNSKKRKSEKGRDGKSCLRIHQQKFWELSRSGRYLCNKI